MTATSLTEIDEPAFTGMAERHRRELHVHCYRMLGSFEDAEDAVQETFLRAWRRRETFEGRSTFRAWLYRIATNACLDFLGKRRPEPAAGGEVLWLQPYPDQLLDDPETVTVARETIELAYVAAVQHLAPRPRAVLILRDVVGWPAKDVADLLGDSVNSVNSALQRARAGLREHLPAERQDWTGGDEDAATRELVRRFTDASVAVDIDTLASLLRDDVRCSMPPTPGLHVGRDDVVADWVADGYPEISGLRAVPTAANPAARRRLLPLAGGGGGVPAADPRRRAHRGWSDRRDRHVPRRPVRAVRVAGAAVMSRRLIGSGLVATVAAMAATALGAALARAAGVDFEVPDGGETIPVSGIAFVAGVCSVVGVGIAAAFARWSAHPAQRFVWTALSLTALSLVPPLLSGGNAATVATLVGLHLLAAAVMIPSLRALMPAWQTTSTPHASPAPAATSPQTQRRSSS